MRSGFPDDSTMDAHGEMRSEFPDDSTMDAHGEAYGKSAVNPRMVRLWMSMGRHMGNLERIPGWLDYGPMDTLFQYTRRKCARKNDFVVVCGSVNTSRPNGAIKLNGYSPKMYPSRWFGARPRHRGHVPVVCV